MPGNISERLFGKTIYDITEEDLLIFFSVEQSETSISEFKSFRSGTDEDANLNKISETLCAFLNSEGGLLIWGSPVGTKLQGANHKVFTGSLTPLQNSLDKDSIVRKVSAKISPLSPNIKFHKVTVFGGFCYIFEVGKSDYAPHQIDGKYSMRLDGSNIPAPHYYVEALMKRISIPKLSGKIVFGKLIFGHQFLAIPLVIYISNQSPYIPEKNLYYDLIATNCKIVKPNEHPKDYITVERNNISGEMKILHYSAPLNHRYFILFRRSNSSLSDIESTMMLSVSGDTSPIITSGYNITVIFSRQFQNYTYKAEVIKESQSVVDHIVQLGKTEAERESESLQFLTNNFDENAHTFAVHSFITTR